MSGCEACAHGLHDLEIERLREVMLRVAIPCDASPVTCPTCHPSRAMAAIAAVAKRARTKHRYEAKRCRCGGWRVARKRARRKGTIAA